MTAVMAVKAQSSSPYFFSQTSESQSLSHPLGNAIRSLEKGKIQPACSQLQDFIDEVNQKVADGVLTQAEGDALIASANAIRDAAGCTP